ncbi:MAG: hypothetical protein K0R17_2374 [Rariglobus sp.]|nr:hypothetical protein [Rariglobus sp.]
MLAGFILVTPSAVSADVLASYLFTGGSAASNDAHAQSVAGSFGFGSAGTNWGLSTAQNNVFGRGSTTAASEALAVSAGSYFTFTLTPGSLGAGNGINLSSITFDTIANSAATTAGTVSATFFVRSSLDGFSANIGSSFPQSYINTTVVNPVARSVDLSAYQGIVSAVEFRIYVFDDSTDVNRTPRLDNVVLNGAVGAIPIPEPATTGLVLAGGLMAFVLFCRRRRA